VPSEERREQTARVVYNLSHPDEAPGCSRTWQRPACPAGHRDQLIVPLPKALLMVHTQQAHNGSRGLPHLTAQVLAVLPQEPSQGLLLVKKDSCVKGSQGPSFTPVK